MRSFLWLSTVALVLALSVHTAGADPIVGQVAVIRGACFVVTSGGRAPLALNDPLHEGDLVDVPVGSRIRLRMADDTLLSVASGTQLQIQRYSAEGARLRLLIGLLRTVVRRLAPGASFEIETETTVAAVRGTDWFTEAKLNSAQIGVLDGKVAITSRATGRSVTIPARWGARNFAGLNPVPPRVWTSAEFADVISRTTVE